MPSNTMIEIQDVPARTTAVVRRHAHISQLPTVIPQGCDEVIEFLSANEVPGRGQPIALYLTCDADMNLDVEIGFEIAARFEGNEKVVCSEIPGGKIAAATHRGPYDGITGTHQAMHAWFAENQQPITGVAWELYGGWSENPEELETEICYQLG